MEYIYKITNNINKKVYIGKSKDVSRRWKEHLSLVGKKRHPFYDAILHYGVDNFSIEIVDEADSLFINELEKKWIWECDSITNGYNMTEGGTGGDTFSNKPDELKEITREKLKKRLIENNPMHNPIVLENYRKLIKTKEYREKYKKGVELRDNPEYRKKISEGVKLTLQSPEKRKKWSECKLGSKNPRWLGYVIVCDLDGNETTYNTSSDAASKLSMASTTIRGHCINGTTPLRGPYKGWTFRFSK